MSIRTNYKHTIAASYIGYITQAIINNFAPLLFLTFSSSWGISLDKITLLVTVNFVIQLGIDLLSAKFIDKIGYRISIVAAHLFAAAGLCAMGILPDLLPDPYIGLLIAIFLYAIGGGLTEVLISPIVEACPTDSKSGAMSLLHSFYCWGHVFVVIMSTVFFAVFGIQNWRILAFIWALIPFFNAFYYMFVPIKTLFEEHESVSMKSLLSNKLFWVFALLMVCAGASEQAMSQWASAFAEAGLRVSKTIGDLAGPCMFALLMGLARLLYARFSERLRLTRVLGLCCITCVCGYLLAVFAPSPILSLAGCGLVGLSVGVFWPGTFSLASSSCAGGGTAMFALLALAGDLGCAGGPTVVGMVSESAGENIKTGLFAAIIFPVLLIGGLIVCGKLKKGERESQNN